MSIRLASKRVHTRYTPKQFIFKDVLVSCRPKNLSTIHLFFLSFFLALSRSLFVTFSVRAWRHQISSVAQCTDVYAILY